MPGALALSQRRLLGALAYAYDGATFSFERLKTAARSYQFPEGGQPPQATGWSPENRLSIVIDVWSCVDHLSRAQKLVRRFPTAQTAPGEITTFLSAMRPASQIRNRIQHLDEDIFDGANSTEGHPVVGAVSWADARFEGGHIRYTVASGPSVDGGNTPTGSITDVDGVADVVDFRLTAADQSVSIDTLMSDLNTFMDWFELTMTRTVLSAMRDAAVAQGIPLTEPRPHGVTDMTMAMRLRRQEDGKWECKEGDVAAIVEVAPGAFDLSQPI